MPLLLLLMKVTALLALGAASAKVARRATASLRHAIWLSTLAATLLLPVSSAWIPRWEVVPAPQTVVKTPGSGVTAGITLTVVSDGARIDWVDIAAAMWFIGAALVFLRWLRGAWQASRIVREGRPAAWAQECLERSLAELGLTRRVNVVESAETSMPFNWGATVVLPASLREVPAGRVRVILLHELAHVERNDTLSQWVAHAAASAYWFHPLAWMALTRSRRERERACDDRVVGLSGKPSAYAADLLEVARAAMRAERRVAALAMAESSELEERVMAILDSGKKRGRLSPLGFLLIVASVLAVVLPMAATQAVGSGTGAVNGIVQDASQTPVKGARVIVTAPGSGGSASVVTDATGAWRVAQLADGKYSVEVQARGFQLLRDVVEVKDGAETRKDLRVEVGRVSEEMTVRAEAGPAPASLPSPAPQARPAPAAPPALQDSNVTPLRLKRQVKPQYPESAKAEKASGQVALRGVVSVDGTVIGLTTITASRPDFEEAAKAAVQQWQFEPAKLNGQPVEVVTDIKINFRPD